MPSTQPLVPSMIKAANLLPATSRNRLIVLSPTGCYSALRLSCADYIPRPNGLLASGRQFFDMAIARRRSTRLFLERDLTARSLSLSDREAHYLVNVLRAKPGDTLVAFNGRGAERLAVVRSATRRGAQLDLLDAVEPLPESKLRLTLVQALIKSDAMDWIVQKATELGVSSITPAYTEHSVVRLDDERAARRVEHWTRIGRSACEQCGRHRPPVVEPPDSLWHCLARLPPKDPKLTLDPASDLRLDCLPPATRGVSLIVGPEGGFSPADTERMDAAGSTRVRLGPRVLRAETAAISACALLQARWGDL